MSVYVDVNELLAYLYNKQDERVDVALEIARFPTVDAVEVVHGRLIETGEDEEYTFYGNCSVCGADNRMYHNYCCNCGARMDGGKNDG